MNELCLYKSYKNEDSRIKTFNTKAFWGILYDNVNGKGKTSINKSVYSEAKKIAYNILHDSRCAHFFTKREGIEVHFQPKYRFTLQGCDLRCMYDFIEINHNKKTIQPFDLKVTSFIQEEFPKNYMKFHYYIQSALYSEGIKSLIKENFEICDYELLPFTFLVYSVTEEFPMLWETPIKNIQKGINGFDTKYGKHIKGVLELAREREFYLENPENKIPFRFVNKEVVKLNELGC